MWCAVGREGLGDHREGGEFQAGGRAKELLSSKLHARRLLVRKQ